MYYYFQILLNILDFSLKYTTVSSIPENFQNPLFAYMSLRVQIQQLSRNAICNINSSSLVSSFHSCHWRWNVGARERDREAKEGGETKRDHACAISSIRFLRDDVFPCLWTGARGHWTFALIIPMAFHTTFPMHPAYSRLEQWQRIVLTSGFTRASGCDSQCYVLRLPIFYD